MYLQHFGLSQLPFTIAPNPDFLFPSKGHQEALAHLSYSLTDHGGLIALTGEVGSGKTTLCRAFMSELPKNTHLAYIFNPQLSPIELLQAICDELMIEYDERSSQKYLFQCINEALLRCFSKGHKVICIIDEAQVMSAPLLEQVRLLTNLETNTEKLLSLVLVGQPELRDLLARHELRQLNQRITARYHLSLLSVTECREYLKHRIQFAGASDNLFIDNAADVIWQRSGGVPRVINSIADRALLGAYATDSELVTVKIARQAAIEVLGESDMTPVSGRHQLGHVSSYDSSHHNASLQNSLSDKQQTYLGGSVDGGNRSFSQINTVLMTLLVVLGVAGLASIFYFNEYNQSIDATTKTVIETDVSAKFSDPSVLLSDHMNIPVSQCHEFIDYGFQCLWVDWSINELRRIDHPVAIKQPNGEWEILSNETRFASGDALVLWRLPDTYNGLVRPGGKAPIVNWVRERLGVTWGQDWSSISPNGKPINIDDNFYDPLLANEVANFQKQAGLNPDKIIGPRTLLHLQKESL